MADDRFDALRSFYARLDGNLQQQQAARRAHQAAASTGASSPATHACGTCDACCRYHFYLSRHEFEYLRHVAEQRPGAPPLRWVTCSTSIQDARRTRFDPQHRCPLYGPLPAGGHGCLAYEARPVACRTMGPMLPHHSRMPEGCVYTDPEVYHSTDAIPGWDELLQLVHEQGESTRGYFEVS